MNDEFSFFWFGIVFFMVAVAALVGFYQVGIRNYIIYLNLLALLIFSLINLSSAKIGPMFRGNSTSTRIIISGGILLFIYSTTYLLIRSLLRFLL